MTDPSQEPTGAEHDLTRPTAADPAFAALLRRAKAGEPEALDELFSRFYGRVERKVHRSLASDVRNGRPWVSARFSTADVVQDIFHGVLRDLGTFQGTSERAFAGYLTMVIRNRIIDSIRFHEADRRDGRRGVRPIETADRDSDSESPPERAAQADEYETYLRALNALPERDQLLLRARLEESATFEELTETLGYPSVSTARRAFLSAKARVAVLLQQGGMHHES